MLLQEQINEKKLENLSKISEEDKIVLFSDAERLAKSDILDSAPKIGDKLEDFYMLNHIGEYKDLDSILEDGPAVITFYRGGWCPYCNLELHAYQEMLPEIKALGATLIAITPEVPDASLTTTE
ncbi:MAG: redoxin domain-containing protein [Spirochaetaceae bacterium]